MEFLYTIPCKMVPNPPRYQIASGAHDGLDQLLGSVYEQFGVVVGLGAEEESRLSAALGKVAGGNMNVASLVDEIAARLGAVRACI